MGEIPTEKKPGCGLMNAVFGRRTLWPRRASSTGSLHRRNPNHVGRTPSTRAQKIPKNGLDEAFLGSTDPNNGDRIIARPDPNHAKQKNQRILNYRPVIEMPIAGYNTARKAPPPGPGPVLSGELDIMVYDHQRSKDASTLIRASSSNVMIFGDLGNLRQPGNNNSNVESTSVLEYLPMSAKEAPFQYKASVMGNVMANKHEKPRKPDKNVLLCRALSTRMDPEELIILGNEDYKNERFAEALALYDAAISIDPKKASYRSNKSAALTAMGKLIEAGFECREAIRIDPFFQRAHNRLATLYVRMGEAERAVYHFKQSGPEADPDAMDKANKLQIHLNKCTELKKRRDLITLLKETGLTIEAGAYSAPLIYGLRAETLLKLNKQQEAIETMEKGPNFDINDCVKFFGPIWSASLLLFRAQVDIVSGRFDEALAAVERASRLDPNNMEANPALRKTKALATSRSNGNELFKAERYSEACIAYGEGLNHDPYNAVLLCNRAACRSKLGQYEKAIEDCNAALSVRSGYSKARLRRADCYAKIENWEACLHDCKVLIRENPRDEEIRKMLDEAETRLGINRASQEISIAVSDAPGLIVVPSNERLRDYLASTGVSMVLFCNKRGNKNIMDTIEPLIPRYPSVKFLKVEVEKNSSLARSEGVLNSLPAFVIYTNGSRSKEVRGDNYDLLEKSIKYYVGL